MTVIQTTAEIEDGGDMDKKKTHWINKYLTNNGRFDRSDILYRKVYLLNSILSIMFIVCLFFVVIDIVIFKMFTAATVNAAAVFLILLTLIYFKETSKYKPKADKK